MKKKDEFKGWLPYEIHVNFKKRNSIWYSPLSKESIEKLKKENKIEEIQEENQKKQLEFEKDNKIEEILDFEKENQKTQLLLNLFSWKVLMFVFALLFIIGIYFYMREKNL